MMVMVITENSVGNPFVKIIKIHFKKIPMREAGRGDPRMQTHLDDKMGALRMLRRKCGVAELRVKNVE